MSAESWAIIDGSTGKFMFGKQENLKREIASLTKIMTCFICIKAIDKLNIDSNSTYIKISKNASS